jgi:hypothetical protein
MKLFTITAFVAALVSAAAVPDSVETKFAPNGIELVKYGESWGEPVSAP